MHFDKMKTFTFFILLTSSLVLINCAQNSSKVDFAASDRKEIMQILNQQAENWSNGNLDKFMEGYWKSDSLQFIKQERIVYGWQETFDNYKKTYSDSTQSVKDLGKLQFEILKINSLSSDAAFLTGKFSLEKDKRMLIGIFTLVFRNIDGRWLIVYDHTS